MRAHGLAGLCEAQYAGRRSLEISTGFVPFEDSGGQLCDPDRLNARMGAEALTKPRPAGAARDLGRGFLRAPIRTCAAGRIALQRHTPGPLVVGRPVAAMPAP